MKKVTICIIFFVLLFGAISVIAQNEETAEEQLGFNADYKEHLTFFRAFCRSKNINYEITDVLDFYNEKNDSNYKAVFFSNGVQFLYRLNSSGNFSMMNIVSENEILAEDTLTNLMAFYESIVDEYEDEDLYMKIAEIVLGVNHGMNENEVRWGRTRLYKKYIEEESNNYIYFWYPEDFDISK